MNRQDRSLQVTLYADGLVLQVGTANMGNMFLVLQARWSFVTELVHIKN